MSESDSTEVPELANEAAPVAEAESPEEDRDTRRQLIDALGLLYRAQVSGSVTALQVHTFHTEPKTVAKESRTRRIED